jgi:hypothetical protein
MTETRDCGDNSCRYKARGRGGMRTNGGCRCDHCPYCGANVRPVPGMNPDDPHRDWCDVKRLCYNCHHIDHADDGRCLFSPGTKYEALDYAHWITARTITYSVTWEVIKPVISLIRRKLSPAGGAVPHDEVLAVLEKRREIRQL